MPHTCLVQHVDTLGCISVPYDPLFFVNITNNASNLLTTTSLDNLTNIKQVPFTPRGMHVVLVEFPQLTTHKRHTLRGCSKELIKIHAIIGCLDRQLMRSSWEKNQGNQRDITTMHISLNIWMRRVAGSCTALRDLLDSSRHMLAKPCSLAL